MQEEGHQAPVASSNLKKALFSLVSILLIFISVWIVRSLSRSERPNYREDERPNRGNGSPPNALFSEEERINFRMLAQLREDSNEGQKSYLEYCIANGYYESTLTTDEKRISFSKVAPEKRKEIVIKLLNTIGGFKNLKSDKEKLSTCKSSWDLLQQIPFRKKT